MLYNDNLDVGLFLGINCARVIKLREIILGSDDDFYAKRIVFGWGVIGMVLFCVSECEELGVNRIFSREVQYDLKKICYFIFKAYTKEIFNLFQITKMFEQDFVKIRLEERLFFFEDR